MARPEKNIPDDVPLPQAVHAAALREDRRKANIDYRTMASLVNYSPSALSQAASGTCFPNWDVTRAFVKGCGGDEAAALERWTKAKAELDSQPTAGQVATPSGALAGRNHLQKRPTARADIQWADGDRYQFSSGNGLTVHLPSDWFARTPQSEGVRRLEAVNSPAGLMAVLTEYRAKAGMPSISEISRRTGASGRERIPRSTLTDVFRQAERVPRLDVVLAAARAFEVPAEEVVAIEQAWLRIKGNTDPEATSELYRFAMNLIRRPEFWRWLRGVTVPFVLGLGLGIVFLVQHIITK